MTDLYLSIGSLSQTPYYLSGLGVNIYSMDELCFYLVRDSYILDADLVDRKLCDYIGEQLGLESIAEALRELIDAGAPVGEMVTTILSKTGYSTEEEIRHIKQILIDNASLSFAAKRKMRADNLVNAGKYSRALEEYHYILSGLKSEDEPELYSAILHNIASTYARMFLFDKVSEYYKRAYEIDGNKESLTLYLAAMRMKMKGEEFDRMAVRCGYDDRIIIDAQRRLSQAENSDPESPYFADVQAILDLKNAGRNLEADQMCSDRLDDWKMDYRRSMDAGYL